MDNDGEVAPIDVLRIVNELRANDNQPITVPFDAQATAPYLDVNGEGLISQDDVALVVSEVIAQWGDSR